MTSLSCALILPADLRDKGNLLAEYMGWGPDNYSVPLTAQGGTEVTHYGLHSWVTEEFPAMLAAPMPQALIDAGYPVADYDAVIAALLVSIKPDSEGNFQDLVAANGLQI